MYLRVIDHSAGPPASYSCTVNVSCLPVRDSNRFGGLMSRMAQMARAIPTAMNDVTNKPDQIGAVVKPTQSQVLPNLVLPFSDGWTCARGRKGKNVRYN